jgi:hypothetical protein
MTTRTRVRTLDEAPVTALGDRDTVKETIMRDASRTHSLPIKRLALAALVVVALASAATAFAGGTLPGTYRATIASPAAIKGTWALTFAKGGGYTVVSKGRVHLRGTYSATGSKLTLGHETGDGACSKPGTYAWKKSGKTLKLTRVHDPAVCSGRIAVLAHAFTQTG